MPNMKNKLFSNHQISSDNIKYKITALYYVNICGMSR